MCLKQTAKLGRFYSIFLPETAPETAPETDTKNIKFYPIYFCTGNKETLRTYFHPISVSESDT